MEDERILYFEVWGAFAVIDGSGCANFFEEKEWQR
jgi:hypothetical protein